MVVTADDEEKYYRETWVPAYKQRNPNAEVPGLDRVRANVAAQLTEDRVRQNMEQFVQQAQQRVTVTRLYEP